MRQIKFRAWTKRWGMVYPDDPEKTINVHSQTVWHDSIDEEFVILEQFTGLLDSQGKEIYEGDIVRHVYNVECYVRDNGSIVVGCIPGNKIIQKETFQVVKWQDHEFVGLFPIYRIGFIAVNNKPDIVGNIHENPEILKQYETN